jgi:hypothetical protein
MRKFLTRGSAIVAITALTSTSLLASLVSPSGAYAVVAPVNLGTAGNYAVLGAAAAGAPGVTNTGFTVLNGDLGDSPSSVVVGFPDGVVHGVTNAGDPQAATAHADLVTAYSAAAQLAPTTTFVGGDQIGQTFYAGVHYSGAAVGLSGTMTLDGGGDPNAVFIFQINAALTTAASTTINLTDGAQAGNVFWQVNGAVTLGATSSFPGTMMANGAITVGAGTSVAGRALAYGAVTLADNTVTVPDTVTFTSPPTPSSASTTSTTDTVLAAGTPGDTGAITYSSTTRRSGQATTNTRFST